MKTLPELYYHLSKDGNVETTNTKVPEAMYALKGYLLVNKLSYREVAQYRRSLFAEKEQQKTIDSLNRLFDS